MVKQILVKETPSVIKWYEYECDYCGSRFKAEYQAQDCQRKCKKKNCNHKLCIEYDLHDHRWDYGGDPGPSVDPHFIIQKKCCNCGYLFGEYIIEGRERIQQFLEDAYCSYDG